MEKPLELRTERLILRRFTRLDAPAFFSLMRDEETNTFLPWFPPATEAEAISLLEKMFLRYDLKEGAYRYAVCLQETNEAIGYVCLEDEGAHDLGYGVGRPYWRQGFAAEAAGAVIQAAKAGGCPFITATHDQKNPRSGGVMKKLGMHYCYSYLEQWQPKDIPVVFRMYQLNLDGSNERVYKGYWEKYAEHFIETDL